MFLSSGEPIQSSLSEIVLSEWKLTELALRVTLRMELTELALRVITLRMEAYKTCPTSHSPNNSLQSLLYESLPAVLPAPIGCAGIRLEREAYRACFQKYSPAVACTVLALRVISLQWGTYPELSFRDISFQWKTYPDLSFRNIIL